ncbi:potassium transporter Kup [Azospira inquinata]|uniref:Probable potassium transport system protein Kup n=2 Tax=Pseudomonadota TaxID=1224 RepID=A0A975SLS9_9RHOO|nr:potassium transporter Kup [Azospira inquinata]QWT46481.1 potassium transporter Kup [Azospira inquinata]QWT48194.1 potassium transporter Kup [Azospira inquinata]
MQGNENRHGGPMAPLALAALGVVYGDIGTSPLYTVHEIFAGAHHPVPVSHDNVLGILSLIFWSLMIVVSLKYVAFIMRADNKGEGGVMALMALVLRGAAGKPYAHGLMLLGLFGAALFYGDGVITPAVSVLSAVEGLEVVTPDFKPFILPIALAVILTLFLFQRHGTASIGKLFGPVMTVWFAALALMGVVSIARYPAVLAALDPRHALGFIAADPRLAFLSLGAVVLALTGAEALYADMGHFGRQPIQLAWFGLVLPALVLNYFGQGALLLTHPDAIENPFYRLAPDWALMPLVGLSTLATVIASQAVISGCYSITQQAMQMGYSPRMAVLHTSDKEQGQIYLPTVNWLLLLAVMALVLGFGSSSNLAAAYGIAVTGTMVITSILAFIVVRSLWGWSLTMGALVLGGFLVLDGAFFFANATKIKDGGWFPLAFGIGLFVIMTTWKRGRVLLRRRLEAEAMPMTDFMASLALSPVPTTPGTAIFMTPDASMVPHPLLHSLKHYQVIHERVVLLSVHFIDTPYVPEGERLTVSHLRDNFWHVAVNYGFKDEPDIPLALDHCAAQGLPLDLAEVSFFLGRETIIPRLGGQLPLWREKLFVALFRNAGSATDFFKLPSNRVVELGSQVTL